MNCETYRWEDNVVVWMGVAMRLKWIMIKEVAPIDAMIL